MAELARANGIEVVIGTVLPVCDCARWDDGTIRVQTRERPPLRIAELNDRIARLARESGYGLVDYHSAMADGVGRLRQELTDDGLHPNRAGYAVMAPPTERAVAAAGERIRRRRAAAPSPVPERRAPMP
jgi:lysophospholipase L1-like esterase